MSDSDRCIILTGSQNAPAPGSAPVCRWNGYDESDGSVSVPVHLDAHAGRIRGRYLAMIHALGAAPLGERTLAEHLSLPRGYNFWHMSLIAEKSPFKSARVIDCVKLLAFEEILVASGATRVRIEQLDATLAEAVSVLCGNLGLTLERGAPGRPATRGWVKRLPHLLGALIFLAHYLHKRWPLRRMRRGWLTQPPVLGMFSYFFNIDGARAEQGRYHSPQWGDFPAFLSGQGIRTNWLEHLVPGAAVRDAATALRWVGRFNADAAQRARHVFVDAELGAGVVGRALANYLRCAWRGARLGGVARHCVPPGSRASLWPLLRDDWYASTRGWPALQAALWIELFDAALASMPRMPSGFYLQENQGWERALIHAWRRHGHGRLVAVAHSTVRFWDLRYFDDPAVFGTEGRTSAPQPDLVAVNGPHAREMLASAGLPAAQLVEVEALRYMHLAGGEDQVAAAPDPAGAGEAPLRLLVAGDSMRSATEDLLHTLARALERCGRPVELRFKPHPFTPVNLARFGLQGASEGAGSIGELIPSADAVLGAISSAMVEAYCLGVQPIIFLGSETVNFSPLVGLADVLVARNVDELAAALRNARRAKGGARRAYFHLDPHLPRWQELLRRLAIGTAA